MVPEVAVNLYWHPRHSHLRFLGSSATSMSPHRMQATPFGQRRPSKALFAFFFTTEFVNQGNEVHGSYS